jgi:hypothetical protein
VSFSLSPSPSLGFAGRSPYPLLTHTVVPLIGY